MSKYKLPVRTQRMLDAGKRPVPRQLSDFPFMCRQTNGTEARQATSPELCLGLAQHSDEDSRIFADSAKTVCVDGESWCCAVPDFQTVKDGMHVCVLCGLTRGNVYVEPPVWHGTHTITIKAKYDFTKHVDRHLSRISAAVRCDDLDRVRAVFPKIYDAFFQVAKHRKNFMSYGFVISKILIMMGIDTKGLDISTVKTPCKIRDCERFWKMVVERVDLSGIKRGPVGKFVTHRKQPASLPAKSNRAPRGTDAKGLDNGNRVRLPRRVLLLSTDFSASADKRNVCSS